jgi:hypothetical protein
MRWGLIPHYAKDPKIAFSTFNARAETVERTVAAARVNLTITTSPEHNLCSAVWNITGAQSRGEFRARIHSAAAESQV